MATLSHDQMIDILRRPGSVSAVIVPPFQSGKPRKYVIVSFIAHFFCLFCFYIVTNQNTEACVLCFFVELLSPENNL